MRGLMLIGAALVIGGVVACGYGVAGRDAAFGNTLILAGVLGACSGLILIALNVVAGELTLIADAFQSGIRDELGGAASSERIIPTASIAPRSVPAPVLEREAEDLDEPPPSYPAGPRPERRGGDAEPIAGRRRRIAETTTLTIVQSGDVDGMAYSLFSDGSIEAQMPDGVVRFVSIHALREHLDQRGR